MTATFEDMITAFRETDEAVAKKLEEDKDTAFLAPLYRLCSEKRIALLEICGEEYDTGKQLPEKSFECCAKYDIKIRAFLEQLSEEQIATAYKIYRGEMYAYGMGIAGYSDDYLDELDTLLGGE